MRVAGLDNWLEQTLLQDASALKAFCQQAFCWNQ